MQVVTVKTKTPYQIEIEAGILGESGKKIAAIAGRKYTSIAIITDKTVQKLYAKQVEDSLCAAGYKVCTFAFEAGESSKSMANAMEIVDFLCQHSITRSDALVALGGGVVGDITGFVASIYNRGVDYIQIPTTFLAAIDSSVGGKTAVNIAAGKNLVGTFWQPRHVICDTDTLKTLSDEIFSDGMAEAIKYGCIWDKSLLDQLESPNLHDKIANIIAHCVEIKAEVVENDELDNGLRQILNFGHTMGHAIEKDSGYKISHGKAVAIGMYMIAVAGEKNGTTKSGTAQKIHAILQANNLPTSWNADIEKLCDYCMGDKKRSGDSINLILLQEIGKTKIHKIKTENMLNFFQN